MNRALPINLLAPPLSAAATAAPSDPAAADPITVFTPYFRAATSERQAELDECLARNLDCPSIHRLVLMVDDGHEPPHHHPKLRVLATTGRPTYRHWIEFGHALAECGISVLANTDIWFDDTIVRLRQSLAGPRRFVALTRHERTGGRIVPHRSPHWSQDTWALRAGEPLPASLMKALDIPLGVPRCDNKVAYLFAVQGWRIFNPLAQVRSVHVHETQQRGYDKKVDLTVLGAVAYVHPSPQPDVPAEVEIDVWALGADAVKGLRLNRSLDLWRSEAVAASSPAPAAPDPAATTAETTPWRSASVAETTAAIDSGRCIFDSLRRFRVWRHGSSLLAFDTLEPAGACAAEGLADDVDALRWLTDERLLEAFVPPRLALDPVSIGERPRASGDSQFWQYPAATEQQAYENHARLVRGANLDRASRTVHTYLGLPWATYIDRKQLPDEVQATFGPRIRGLARLARECGWRLAVHTVCQQIHWRRLVETFAALGVTDLHLAHATDDLDPAAEGWPFQVHGWPLIAPNVEVTERSAGLLIGKPVAEKRWLASFIGAHMKHYRSDVRLRLAEAARDSGRDDVLVDLGDEWHFNKVVYQEQVLDKALADDDHVAELRAAHRYNELLSDSVFSLCPEGAGPNTLRLWESLAVGAIPVILAAGWTPPVSRRGKDALEECCVYCPPDRIEGLFDRLAAMPAGQRDAMQALCMELYRDIRQRTCFGASAAVYTNDSTA